MSIFRFLAFSFFVILISCRDTPPNVPEIEVPYADFSWNQIALQDTIVFDLTVTASGQIYAFTGLEVYVSESVNDLDFTEIISLRNRDGFIAEPDSNWIVSIQDSSILYTRSPGTVFNEETISGNVITSTVLSGNRMYATSSQGPLFSFDLQSTQLDTLYSEATSDDLSLISIVDDELYIKKGSQIEVMDVNTKEFKPSNLPTSNISKVVSVNETETLLAASVNQKILISNDRGSSWQEIGPEEIPANAVTDLLITDQFLFFASFLGSGVFISQDLGNTWYSLTTNELDWNTYAVEWIPDKGLLAATATGIYLQD